MSTLALFGGEPVRSKPWPTWPDRREEDVRAVAEVVDSGQWWSYAGDHVHRFEEEFAAYHDARFGITVNSGTTALMVALQALGIGPGDEVIVPAYTFVATASSVLLANAVPVFADVEPATANLDPEDVARRLTPRTKAIVPVHIAGLPADMARLGALAAQHGLAILEDSAQAHGAVWQGKKVGSIGGAGAFSFQASKNLCAGEGGIVTTNDPQVEVVAAAISDCGRAAGRPFYEHHRIGQNFRMTELQAALLRSRMRTLEEETARRFRNGRALTERISQLSGLEPLDPTPGPGDRRAYHLYPVRVHPETLGASRERVIAALNAEGIPAGAGYGKPLYDNPVFQEGHFNLHGCPVNCGHYHGTVDYREASCPATEALCAETLWLGQNLLLGDENDTADIVHAFEKVVENRGGL